MNIWLALDVLSCHRPHQPCLEMEVLEVLLLSCVSDSYYPALSESPSTHSNRDLPQPRLTLLDPRPLLHIYELLWREEPARYGDGSSGSSRALKCAARHHGTDTPAPDLMTQAITKHPGRMLRVGPKAVLIARPDLVRYLVGFMLTQYGGRLKHRIPAK